MEHFDKFASRHDYLIVINITSYLQAFGVMTSVRSLVCKEMFSDYFIYCIPCTIFPALTELRLYFLRWLTNGLAEFVIAHSSTLTHLSVKNSKQSYIGDDLQTLFHTVLPHLTQLKLLSLNWGNYVMV